MYSTITDTNANGVGDSVDEVLAETWSDGAGRVLKSRTPHTFDANGNTLTWAATFAEYDILGRVKKQSVPTEVNSSWAAAGDDATRGFLWTYQKYDWKGRVVRKINTDGIDQATLNDSDILISYEGCGCAGGQITTIQSEMVPRDDTTGNARRVQKIYEDILGRGYKTLVYKWDGTTAYTTTEQFFNGRDQVTRTKQTDNTSTATPQTFREVTTTYDGHGRTRTRHYPIEDAEAETTWDYNPDGSVKQVTDPRGAVTDITYNVLGSTTQIAYTPVSGLPDTPTVTFGYDDLGNRVSMDTAGVSEVTYAYDPLSRMTSETVNFDDLANNLTIGYTYGLTGLKSITDPSGKEIEYTKDRAGRLTAVTGDAFGQNTTGTYASGSQYRAFGQVKQMDYNLSNGNSRIKLDYDNRLRVDHSEATQAGSTTAFVLKADYEYLADGRVAAKDDKLNDTWDRTNKYDFAGRLSFNQFGLSGSKRVYEQNVDYNAFSEMYYRATTYWGATSTLNAAYLNGRKTGPQTPAPDYDAAGNLVFERTDDHNMQTTTYDAAGRRVAFRDRWRMSASASEETETQFVYDGDGRPVVERHGSRTINTPTPPPMVVATTGYQVWSSVLGTSLTSVNTSGEKVETKVFAGGTHIATQHEMNPATTSDDSLTFVTADPVTGSVARYSGSGASADIEESEPLGQMIETSDPGTGYPTSYEDVRGIARDPEWQCRVAEMRKSAFNEMPVHCKKAALAGKGFNVPMALAESDPIRVAKMSSKLTDSPLPKFHIPDGGYSPSNRALAFSAKATDKSSTEEREGGCDWDKDGTDDCAATITDPGPDPLASIDASLSGGNGDCPPGMICPKPAPRPTPVPKNSPNSTACDNVVGHLAASAEGAVAGGRVALGRALMGLAQHYATGSDGGRGLPVGGFRSQLVDWGQRGHVYRHIYAHAGSILVGAATVLPRPIAARGMGRIMPNETGNSISNRELQADIAQLQDPEHEQEAAAEINGTNAGRRIGSILVAAMANRSKTNWDTVAGQIRSLICE